jgi:hypothetical protein
MHGDIEHNMYILFPSLMLPLPSGGHNLLGKCRVVLRMMPAPSFAKLKKVVGPRWRAMAVSVRSSSSAVFCGMRPAASLRSSAKTARKSRPASEKDCCHAITSRRVAQHATAASVCDSSNTITCNMHHQANAKILCMWQDDIIDACLERVYTSAGPPMGDQASDRP